MQTRFSIARCCCVDDESCNGPSEYSDDFDTLESLWFIESPRSPTPSIDTNRLKITGDGIVFFPALINELFVFCGSGGVDFEGGEVLSVSLDLEDWPANSFHLGVYFSGISTGDPERFALVARRWFNGISTVLDYYYLHGGIISGVIAGVTPAKGDTIRMDIWYDAVEDEEVMEMYINSVLEEESRRASPSPINVAGDFEAGVMFYLASTSVGIVDNFGLTHA